MQYESILNSAASQEQLKTREEMLLTVAESIGVRVGQPVETPLMLEDSPDGTKRAAKENTAIAAKNMFNAFRLKYPDAAALIKGNFFLPTHKEIETYSVSSESYSRDGMRGGGDEYRTGVRTIGRNYIALTNGKVMPYELYTAIRATPSGSEKFRAIAWMLNKANREKLPTEKEVLIRWAGNLLQRYSRGNYSEGASIAVEGNTIGISTNSTGRVVLESPTVQFDINIKPGVDEYAKLLDKIWELAGTPKDILPWAESGNYDLAVEEIVQAMKKEYYQHEVIEARKWLVAEGGLNAEEVTALSDQEVIEWRKGL